jgi:hypothetical protein
VTVVESAEQKLPQTMNFSLGIQRELGFRSVIDISYVGSLARHLINQRNINSIPMYARFDPANRDTTTASSPLPDNYLRPYLGMSTINMRTFDGTSNYHGMQMSVNRRMTNGLQFGVSYTFAKSLGVSNADFGGLSYYFPWRRGNYGPLGYDIRHMAVINYNYEVPNLGQRLNNKFLGIITDNWQISGITQFMSGTPFTPGFSTIRRPGHHRIAGGRQNQRPLRPLPARERAHLRPELQDGGLRPARAAHLRQRRREHHAQSELEQLGHELLEAHPAGQRDNATSSCVASSTTSGTTPSEMVSEISVPDGFCEDWLPWFAKSLLFQGLFRLAVVRPEFVRFGLRIVPGPI